ncbi:MAG: hypothetical protein M3401_15275 [Actinomycetota bacterium]|nr:hypothetical protein [Actinomycetota bacterium]
MSARRGTAGAATALALSVGGCGTPSPDLFVVNRDGRVPGAKLTLLVSDTSARCNNGPARPLTSAQTIEARDLSDDLLEFQAGDRLIHTSGPAQIFSFTVRTETGRLRYPDTAQRPPVLPRLSRFVRRTAIDLCGLRR